MEDVATGLAAELKNDVDIAGKIATDILTTGHTYSSLHIENSNYSLLSFRNEDISKNRKITFSHVIAAMQPVKNKQHIKTFHCLFLSSLEIRFFDIHRSLSGRRSF